MSLVLQAKERILKQSPLDMSAYQLVLFDVDGTMAETEGLGHLPAFNAAFKEYSLPWQWDECIYKELLQVTGGLERLKTFRAQVADKTSASIQTVSDQLLQQVHLRKNQIYAKLIADGKVLPRPGLVDLINQLASRGKQWGVVTTTSQSNWDSLWLSVLKPHILIAPAVVVCGEDVAKKKPDPEAYILASKKMNFHPSACLAIEDSDNGVLSACLAGMDVIALRSQFFADGVFAGAKDVINEFSQLHLRY